MDPLLAGIDLAPALRTLETDGAAFLPGALDEGFRRRLQRLLEDLAYEPAEEVVGPVRQQTESASLPAGAVPEIDALMGAFARAVRDQGRGIRGLATWRPNDVAVQRYRPGALGITPHLDGKRFRRLVAVFTTRGRARFRIHQMRDGPPIATWEPGPGDLVLLRGPGLGGLRDGRPFHAVEGPRRGVRYSLALRMRSE